MKEQKTLKSDFSRQNAYYIAEAASRGHITSILSGAATNFWWVTKEGYELLKKEGYI
jgi:hypothetical protein